MAGRRRKAGFDRPGLSQHSLASDALALRLVADANVGAQDRVIEFGAGTGTLTQALAGRAAQVLAIELDPGLAARLSERFASTPAVSVWRGDAISFPLPTTPYRVVSNAPFHRTSALLHRLLDDPHGALARADLILQWQVTRQRAAVSAGPPLDLLGAIWGPWWQFRRGRRLPAALFQPRPSVHAAVLIIERRRPPLLAASSHERYAAFVRRGFEHAEHRSFLTETFGPRPAAEFERALSLSPRAAPPNLDLEQWVRLFQALSRTT